MPEIEKRIERPTTIVTVIECPCCEGRGTLLVHDETDINPPSRFECTHCMGRCVIPASD
jgi:hypothetical protein